ncbi:MAG: hypothetical protein WCW13_00215 [archaeon]|jgi:hypothetical protein
MNFPVGPVISKGNVTYNITDVAGQLVSKSFNGYIIQSVRGDFIEEGALFFRDGEMIGCIVECLAVEKTLKGNEALPFFMNQTKGNGFYQCVSLVRSQVDLITAFDEKLLVNKIALKELPRLIPLVFSPKFERSESKVDSLQNYGLGELK